MSIEIVFNVFQGHEYVRFHVDGQALGYMLPRYATNILRQQRQCFCVLLWFDLYLIASSDTNLSTSTRNLTFLTSSHLPYYTDCSMFNPCVATDYPPQQAVPCRSLNTPLTCNSHSDPHQLCRAVVLRIPGGLLSRQRHLHCYRAANH